MSSSSGSKVPVDSSSRSKNPDVSLSLSLSSVDPRQDLKPEERGIQLIQLLLTCANHASSGNLQHADATLQEISQLASVTGDSIQRLASRFASALAIRLIKRWSGLHKALHHTVAPSVDLDQARSIFTRTFPYLGFAYAVVNRTLIQVMSEERLIHIIDLGSGDPKLWIPFLRSLAVHVPQGHLQLKITCVHHNIVVLERLGAKLAKEAKSLDIALQFNPVNVKLRELNIEMLKVKPGEAVAFTSVLHLHILLAEDDRINAYFGFNMAGDEVKGSQKMVDFLKMMQSLSPKIVLLVEQESHHNMTRLGDRFFQGLHYYSSLFDSISTSFEGSSSEERFAVEEMFGIEIENIVACEGLEREERHEPFSMWTVRLGRAGFSQVRLWHETMEDAKRLVQAYGMDGYKIKGEAGGLMICWHDRPIYTVSAWISSR